VSCRRSNSLNDIVRQHWRKVFNLAYKFVGRHDEAEDLTQDIFSRSSKRCTRSTGARTSDVAHQHQPQSVH
jgi:DNA-directed RNA polymerase specialized sigma24 family protein